MVDAMSRNILDHIVQCSIFVREPVMGPLILNFPLQMDRNVIFRRAITGSNVSDRETVLVVVIQEGAFLLSVFWSQSENPMLKLSMVYGFIRQFLL